MTFDKEMRLGSSKFLHSLTAQNFIFFRCETLKHQNRGKTFLREGMKYFTPAFVKEKSSFCGTMSVEHFILNKHN